MTWKRRIGWAAIAFGVLILVVVIGGYFYLKSASFQRYALSKIAQVADEATGGKATIGGMDFSLSQLTASLYDITVRGTESRQQPPLLHADKLTVRIKILSFLHHQVSVRELLIDHPVAHIEVSRSGTSNLPSAPHSKNSSRTDLFDLAVGHVQLTNGEVNYNDQKTPLYADLYDLTTDVRFGSLPKRYDGSLFYRNGHISYGNRAALPHDLDLRFTATPDKLDVHSAVLRVGSSDISLHAQLVNYSDPVADGNYQIRIHTQDLSRFSPSAQAEGDVVLSGELHYATQPNQPLLRNVSVTGKLASDALAAAASGRRLELRRLEAGYQLACGNLKISNLSVGLLGGRVVANAEMNHLDGTPESRVRASLQGVSLRALQRLSGTQSIPEATVSGTLAGTAEAAWKGAMDKLKARSDLTVQARAESNTHSSAAEVPVKGAIHLTYDGASGSVELHNTALRMPSAILTAQGTISERSSLQIQMVTDDLHQLAVLAYSFRQGQNAVPAVSGRATVNALVQGSVKNPNITARLNAQNLQVEGSEWSGANLTLLANPSQLTVENGSLANAHKGKATFDAKVKLHNWSYQPNDPVQARLNAQQMRITDLLQIANQHYPVSGDLTANLAFNGSQLDPAGSGQIAIANASVYGELLQRLTTNIQAENGSIATRMTAASQAGTIHADLSYTPKTKAYKLKVDAPGVVLQKLKLLQAKNVPVTGTLNAAVSGEGTVEDPQLLATVEIPELQAHGQSIYAMKAQARVAQHKLDVNMDSEVSQVPVRAHGEVALTGDYNADASIDTGTVPLDAIMAAYAPSVPSGFQGQTELHATLSGPLKNKARLQAHLSIPVLKASYQQLQIGIAKPIRADYANSVVSLQPSEIEGTGTKLNFEGKVPLSGPTAPTLAAQGTVDLRIVRIVVPNVSSGGTVDLDVHSSLSNGRAAIGGQLKLKNVAMSTADAPVGIEKLNGTVQILNDRLELSDVNGQMNGGQVTFGGSVTYRPSVQFALAVQSKSVRLLYPTGLRSLLDANLALSGTTAASTLNGRILIDGLSFTPDFDLSSFADQFSTGGTVSQPGFADTVHLAIAVQSSENLNATSSQVSIEGQAALQVGGTAANPVVTGRTTLTSGELFYRNVRYELQNGVITFDNPNETHPVLNIAVSTTIEQYNLTLTLRGPLDKLTTSYVSDPPLATADIINLVARGKTTQEAAASSQSTDSMIASQVAGQLSSSVQKLAGISSLSIDPTLGGNQNPSARVAIQQRVTRNMLFTFSTDVSQPGSEIVQGEYQINKRWSVSVERDQLGGVSVDGRYHTRF
ncbi:MAG TPA: translocation/assembly module TamB domain-containing protein [Dongiaceae bacterium]|nr:translocation/assembly module TamB domain-containing protein [Dongiaceae bacterium]